MKIFGRFAAAALRMMAALPLTTIFFAGTVFAFSDMSDSVAQADLVKTLQKRVDSLEVRVEKTEIERREEKKMAIDWDRGIYINTGIGIPTLLDSRMSVGYMIRHYRKNGTSCILSPVLHIGPGVNISTLRGESDTAYQYGATFMFGTGIQKSNRILDRVSYTTGIYLDVLPDSHSDRLRVSAVGLGFEGAINFWFDERNSVGAGVDMCLAASRARDQSWRQWLNAEGAGATANVVSAVRVLWTYYFAKHSGRAR